jgi:hypothetical protein
MRDAPSPSPPCACCRLASLWLSLGKCGIIRFMQTYPNGSETTDGRFVKVDDNAWWDTTGVDLVTEDDIERHMIANRVGIVVFEEAKVVTLH